MKIFFLLSAFAWLFTTAGYPSRLFAPASSNPVIENTGMPVMWVQNKDIFLGDTLHLRFQSPHPQYLGVIDPEGSFFYLVYPASEATEGLKPLLDSRKFIHLDHLDIPIANLKADPYKYGVMENQPVFNKSGTYTFILGENLHTDHPSVPINRIKVAYKHTTRRTIQ